MTQKQYKLKLFADQLGAETRRDNAIATARELYDLGHRLNVVRALVYEARLHNQRAWRCRRSIRLLEDSNG